MYVRNPGEMRGSSSGDVCIMLRFGVMAAEDSIASTEWDGGLDLDPLFNIVESDINCLPRLQSTSLEACPDMRTLVLP